MTKTIPKYYLNTDTIEKEIYKDSKVLHISEHHGG
jgi:hypothetical protein